MHTLDGRLKAVLSMIPEGSVTADVGTDHGYIPAALLEKNICPFVYACDLRQGPLAAAERTLSGCDPTRWKALLSDGLADLPPEVETVVMAGMGHDVLLGILDRRRSFWTPERTFVIQPMNRQDKLRSGMRERGFSAVREKAAVSAGKSYTVIVYRHTGETAPLTAGETACGLHLSQPPDEAAWVYLAGRRIWLERMIHGCEAARNTQRAEREKLNFARAALEELNTAEQRFGREEAVI